MLSLHLANTRLVVGTVAGAALGVALTPVAAPAIVGFFGFSTLGPTGRRLLPQMS
jgi:hypothetical protein